MKFLILISFSFLVLSKTFAQEIPKGTNTIIVKQSDIKLIVTTLEEKGFAVANDGYGILTTFPKRMPNKGVVVITVKVRDSLSYISGIFEDKIITPELFKMKESYGGHELEGSFNILKDVAISLHGEIQYIKQ